MTYRRPARALAAGATLAIALLSLAGCGDDEKSDDDAPSSLESSEEPSDEDASAPQVGPEVSVLDTGSDPRTELVLDVEEGQVERSTVEMTIGTSVAGAPVTELPMTMVLSSTVQDVADDEITVSYGYESVDAELPPGTPPEAEAQLEEVTSALEETTGTGRITTRNATISSELDLPADAPPEIAAVLDQFTSQASNLSVPFPAEPVGVGASWEIESELTVAGTTTTQVGTYTLESLDGDSYTIAARQVQTPEPGSGSGYTVVEGSTTVDGTYSGTLGTVAASSGSLSGDGTTVVEVNGQQTETATTISMEITTEVE